MPLCLAFPIRTNEPKWQRQGAAERKTESLCDVPLCIVSYPRMFCFLKGVLAPSHEQRKVRGVSAGEITSQAELMAADREERAVERDRGRVGCAR